VLPAAPRQPGVLVPASLRALVAIALALVVSALPAALAAQSAAPELAEGRRLFDALEYEQAMPFLDQAIAALEPDAARDAPTRAALISALEMRARARFGMGNQEGAVTDFRSLLALDPGFALDPGVSPRVVAMLDEVRTATIGTIELTLDPGDAQLVVDGMPRESGNGRIAVAAGAHTLRVSRTGFRPIDQPVTVLAGQSLPLRVTLERVGSVVTLVTTPPGAEVFVNGVSKGRTEAAAAGAADNPLATQLGVPAEQVATLVLTDLTTGSFDVEFRRDCYVTEKRRLSLAELGDIAVEPVVLKPSTGALVLDSEPTGASVLIDGEARGTAPVTIDDVCAGTHLVEFRTPVGRSVERVALETGATLTVQGRVRPAFALLAAETVPDERRLAVERAMAASDTILLYAPPADVLKDVTAEGGPADDWFGIGGGEPPPDLRERGRKLAEALGAQGLAWVKVARPGSPEVRLSLMAPGSTDPDEFTLVLDQPDSVKQVLDRLRTPLVFSRGSLGVTVIDVLDVKGAVVADLDPLAAAAEAGLAAGDIVVQLDGADVVSALDMESKLASRQPGARVTLGVKTRAGQTTSVTAALKRVPAMVVSGDRFLPANVVVAVLRARLAQTTDPALQPIIRLNLAAALLRAGDASQARALLQETQLPAGPGVSAGTVQYLLGEAALIEGDQAAARQAWEAASQADGRLTDDGPPVRALAARALARMR
jgi:PDZ domain/PEGA domain